MATDHRVITDHGQWVEQVDEVELLGGWAEVVFAPEFAAAADTSACRVHLTSYDAVLVFVQNRTDRSFEIHAVPVTRRGRRLTARCGYRVIALRRAAMSPSDPA